MKLLKRFKRGWRFSKKALNSSKKAVGQKGSSQKGNREFFAIMLPNCTKTHTLSDTAENVMDIQ